MVNMLLQMVTAKILLLMMLMGFQLLKKYCCSATGTIDQETFEVRITLSLVFFVDHSLPISLKLNNSSVLIKLPSVLFQSLTIYKKTNTGFNSICYDRNKNYTLISLLVLVLASFYNQAIGSFKIKVQQ